jgi:hypothetical protein
MELLKNVPGVIVSSILSDWISMRDLSHFDSACCSKASRSAYLASLSQMRPFSEEINVSSRSACVWITNRDINVTNISLGTMHTMDSHDVRGLFLKLGRVLTHLTYNSRGDEDSITTVLMLTKYCFMLQSVELRGDIGRGAQTLLFGRLPHLTTINVNNRKEFDELSMKIIAHSCPKLQHLRMLGTSSTDAGLIGIAQSCPDLRTVQCTNCSDMSIDEVARNCPNLEDFFVKQISSSTLQAVAQQCRGLKSIGIKTAVGINDASLVAVATLCPTLHHVVLLNSSALTNNSITALTGLRSLCLSGNRHITDSALECVALRCPLLHSVVITQCAQLTQVAPAAFLRHCPKLQNLEITSGHGGERIAQSSLLFLLAKQVCPFLDTLVLCRNFLITM